LSYGLFPLIVPLMDATVTGRYIDRFRNGTSVKMVTAAELLRESFPGPSPCCWRISQHLPSYPARLAPTVESLGTSALFLNPWPAKTCGRDC